MRGERQKLGQKELSRPSPLFLVGSDGQLRFWVFSYAPNLSQQEMRTLSVPTNQIPWFPLKGAGELRLWPQKRGMLLCGNRIPPKIYIYKSTHQNSSSPLRSDLLDSKK